MSKIVVFFIILMFLIISVSLTGCIEKNEILDQYSIEDNILFDFLITEYNDVAQSFIPTVKEISRIELKIEKQGDPRWINLSIRNNLYDSDLVFYSKHSGQFPPGTDWINFDIEDLEVTPGDNYYIVVKTESGIMSDYYKWRGSDNNYYSNGTGWKLDPFTSVWNQRPTTDFCFKTYGYSGFSSSNYLVQRFLQTIEKNQNLNQMFNTIFTK